MEEKEFCRRCRRANIYCESFVLANILIQIHTEAPDNLFQKEKCPNAWGYNAERLDQKTPARPFLHQDVRYASMLLAHKGQ